MTLLKQENINEYSINGNNVIISRQGWDFTASATIKEEFIDEFVGISWIKKGRYIYSNKLKEYLHIYVIKQWYGEKVYNNLKENGFVVDHMDNNGHNCYINNLCFLPDNENKAKGLTVDKYVADKRYVALSMY